MNMIKKTDGFTLVELIVVIAILAILAAIAVPAYSGYIAKANEAADYTQLDAIKTAATFAYTEKHPETAVQTISVNLTTFGVVVNDDLTNAAGDSLEETFATLAPYFDHSKLVIKSGATAASWDSTNSKWTLTK